MVIFMLTKERLAAAHSRAHRQRDLRHGCWSLRGRRRNLLRRQRGSKRCCLARCQPSRDRSHGPNHICLLYQLARLPKFHVP